MNNTLKPIGVFDSGVGGLTAMKVLQEILPNEDIIYFGDTARVPYGSHSFDTIRKIALQDLNYLLNQNVKAVLIACGTVSSTAIDLLRFVAEVPIIGVVDATASKAVAISENRKIVVLATQATVRSKAYTNAIVHLDRNVHVLEKACPMFVPLIENGYTNRDNPITKMVVQDYLKEIVPFGADTIILGCTHYPLIKDTISDFIPDVNIVEAGKEAAYRLAENIKALSLNNKKKHGTRRFVVSEETESFFDICERFLGKRITELIEVVNLD